MWSPHFPTMPENRNLLYPRFITIVLYGVSFAPNLFLKVCFSSGTHIYKYFGHLDQTEFSVLKWDIIFDKALQNLIAKVYPWMGCLVFIKLFLKGCEFHLHIGILTVLNLLFIMWIATSFCIYSSDLTSNI